MKLSECQIKSKLLHIKGSSILLEGLNHISADKKAPITITGNKSVLIKLSKIETAGDLDITTLNFHPIDGNILVSFGSYIKADKVHLNSKSSLVINLFSKFNSNSNVFDGGNCEINTTEDDELKYNGVIKILKKFAPQVVFTGSCALNPIPLNLKIISTIDSKNNQLSNFNLLNAPITSKTNWIINNVEVSSGQSASHYFIYPGKHLVQALVTDSNGYFRKISSIISIAPSQFNNGQFSIFQFAGGKSAPSKLQAIIDSKLIFFQKSSQNPEIYFAEINVKSSGMKIIKFPYFNYEIATKVLILPAISNPDEYIRTHIDVVLDDIETSSTSSLKNAAIYNNLSALIRNLKLKINELSPSEKALLAKMLQANFINPLVTIVDNSKYKKFNILNFFISEAHAQEGVFDYLDLSSKQLGKFVAKTVGFLGLVGVFSVVSYATADLCPHIWCRVGLGLGVALVVYEVAKAEDEAFELIGDSHIPKKDSFSGHVSGNAYSGQNTVIKFKGTFIPVDSIPMSNDSLVVKSVEQRNNFNMLIESLNSGIGSINKNFTSFGFNSPVESFILLSFPQTTVNSFLSPTSIKSSKIIYPLDGSASVQSLDVSGGNLNIIINSQKSQIVKIRFEVESKDFEMQKHIEVDVNVVVESKLRADFTYTKTGLVVNFIAADVADPNTEGYIYEWDFGDGQGLITSAINITNMYSHAGQYNVTLKVTDSFNNTVSAQKTIILNTDSKPSKICNASRTDLTIFLENFEPVVLKAKAEACECKYYYNLEKKSYLNLRIQSSDLIHPAVPQPIPFEDYVSSEFHFGSINGYTGELIEQYLVNINTSYDYVWGPNYSVIGYKGVYHISAYDLSNACVNGNIIK